MDPATTGAFIQYGAIGLLALIALWFANKKDQQNDKFVQEIIEQRDAAQVKVDELNKLLRDDFLKTSIDMNNTSKAMMDYLLTEKARKEK